MCQIGSKLFLNDIGSVPLFPMDRNHATTSSSQVWVDAQQVIDKVVTNSRGSSIKTSPIVMTDEQIHEFV